VIVIFFIYLIFLKVKTIRHISVMCPGQYCRFTTICNGETLRYEKINNKLVFRLNTRGNELKRNTHKIHYFLPNKYCVQKLCGNIRQYQYFRFNLWLFKGNVAWDWDWLKVKLMHRSVSVVVFKILKAPSTFNKCQQKRGPSEKRDGNCHVLADSCWDMLLTAVGQLLGTAKRV
jgi:hypothetical protein